MALRDTLNNIKSNNIVEKLDIEKTVRDWKVTVETLLSEISGYLNEYVESGDLYIEIHEMNLEEYIMGIYAVDSLVIKSKNSTILVQPIGRMIAGATGRVDLYRDGRTGEDERSILLQYKTPLEAVPAWHLSMPLTISRGIHERRKYIEFNKSTLEQAVDYLLG